MQGKQEQMESIAITLAKYNTILIVNRNLQAGADKCQCSMNGNASCSHTYTPNYNQLSPARFPRACKKLRGRCERNFEADLMDRLRRLNDLKLN